MADVVDSVKSKASNASIPQFQYAMGNLSTVFGWQMAGSALTDNQLDVTCADPANTAHGKWAAEGLIPANIREPICNASHANPNATTAVPYALQSASELFVTQILHAFDPSNATIFNYLCTNLRFLSLDGFYLDDARVINATCGQGDLQLPPRPVEPLVKVNASATAAYTHAASILYGLMFASSATSDTELNVYCAHAAQYVKSLDHLMFNGTLVESTICDVRAPMSANAGAVAIRTFTTHMFVTVLESISSVGGWLDWLCANLDVEELETVGLDGKYVHNQVCADAKG